MARPRRLARDTGRPLGVVAPADRRRRADRGDRAPPPEPLRPPRPGGASGPRAAPRPARGPRHPPRPRSAGAAPPCALRGGPHPGRGAVRRILGVAMVLTEAPMILRVFRWSPGVARSRFDRFRIDPGEGTTVLDALVEV